MDDLRGQKMTLTPNRTRLDGKINDLILKSPLESGHYYAHNLMDNFWTIIEGPLQSQLKDDLDSKVKED